MTGMDGIEKAGRIRQVDDSVQVLILTAAAPVTTCVARNVRAAGIREVVPKGSDPTCLVDTIGTDATSPASVAPPLSHQQNSPALGTPRRRDR